MADKMCTACGEAKQVAEFYSGVAKCKPCHLGSSRDYHAANREAIMERKRSRYSTWSPERKEEKRKAAYFRRYGMTEERRDEMLAAQGGVCAICKSDDPNGPTWCTDHDHACCDNKARSCGGCVRGVLCFRCNTLLGHAKDNTETLAAAIVYLNEWSAVRG